MADDYSGQSDAAEMEPKFVPPSALMPRDNSGGLGFKGHKGDFGEGGFVYGGAKPYLSTKGGAKDKDADRD